MRAGVGELVASGEWHGDLAAWLARIQGQGDRPGEPGLKWAEAVRLEGLGSGQGAARMGYSFSQETAHGRGDVRMPPEHRKPSVSPW